MIKVRFHLAYGPHYMQWQITQGKQKTYVDPNSYSLIMKNCEIVNHESISKRIYKGATKTVCSWIRCKELDIIHPGEKDIFFSENLKFNPRENPYWVYYTLTLKGGTFSIIKTQGNKLHAII